MYKEASVKLIYLLPYLLDLNPIEEFFAKLKSFIKSSWGFYEDDLNQGLDVFLE